MILPIDFNEWLDACPFDNPNFEIRFRDNQYTFHWFGYIDEEKFSYSYQISKNVLGCVSHLPSFLESVLELCHYVMITMYAEKL